MLTSWGKGCLNSSQLCVLTRRNSERPLCSLHLSKQAAFLEPGQLDDLLILGKKKKVRPKLTASGTCVHAAMPRQSLILMFVTLKSWGSGWTPLCLALGSGCERIHSVHQGYIFSRQRVNVSASLSPQRLSFPFNIKLIDKFLESSCLERVGFYLKSQT